MCIECAKKDQSEHEKQKRQTEKRTTTRRQNDSLWGEPSIEEHGGDIEMERANTRNAEVTK